MNETEDRTGTDFDQALSEQAHRYSGALGIGPAADSVQIDHEICVVYCVNPRRKNRHLGCPSCYGGIAVRALTGDEIPPAGTRWAWLVGSFLGGWAAAWKDATVGMVRQ